MAHPQRVALFENARGLLIVLVAMGHALEPPLSKDATARGLYSAIYLWHIPAFAFLSGHLSAARWDRKTLTSLATTILLPLIIFQVLYVLFDVWILGRPFKTEWLYTPYWILWFLLSLCFWRLMLPLFRRLPAPVVWAVALSVIAGALPFVGYPLSASRTLVFFPFFVAGNVVPREWLTRSHAALIRGAAGLVFAALLGWAVGISMGVFAAPNTQWLYGSSTFEKLGVSFSSGALIRCAQFVAALAATAAFFVLCPRPSSALTAYGGRSLAPFLLHGFVIRLADQHGLIAALPFFGAMFAGGVLALILGWTPIARATEPLWNPAGFARSRVVQRPKP